MSIISTTARHTPHFYTNRNGSRIICTYYNRATCLRFTGLFQSRESQDRGNNTNRSCVHHLDPGDLTGAVNQDLGTSPYREHIHAGHVPRPTRPEQNQQHANQIRYPFPTRSPVPGYLGVASSHPTTIIVCWSQERTRHDARSREERGPNETRIPFQRKITYIQALEKKRHRKQRITFMSCK